MLITMETRLDDATTEQFLAVYRDSFAPLEDKAAARQSLTDDEFRDEMHHTSVLKFVAWDESGHPAAIAFVATDLSVVPWISIPYYATRFPEQFARGVIYYFGALLVRPDHRGGTTSYELLKELSRFTAMNGGIAAFDCCRFNEEAVKLPELIAAVAREVCVVDPQQIDAQRYYAYVTNGLREGYSTDPIPSVRDLVALGAEEGAVIDLVALETEEAAQDAPRSKEHRSRA